MLTEHLIEKGENKVISKDQECGERDTALKCFWKAKKKESCMSYLSLDFKQCIFPSHHTSSSRCLLQAKTQRHKLSVIVSHSPASADRKGECFFFFPLPASRPSLHPSVTPPPLPEPSLYLSLSLQLTFPVLFTAMSEPGWTVFDFLCLLSAFSSVPTAYCTSGTRAHKRDNTTATSTCMGNAQERHSQRNHEDKRSR